MKTSQHLMVTLQCFDTKKEFQSIFGDVENYKLDLPNLGVLANKVVNVTPSFRIHTQICDNSTRTVNVNSTSVGTLLYWTIEGPTFRTVPEREKRDSLQVPDDPRFQQQLVTTHLSFVPAEDNYIEPSVDVSSAISMVPIICTLMMIAAFSTTVILEEMSFQPDILQAIRDIHRVLRFANLYLFCILYYVMNVIVEPLLFMIFVVQVLPLLSLFIKPTE